MLNSKNQIKMSEKQCHSVPLSAISSRSAPATDDRQTSLPLLRSWPSVYIFVTASFIVWVVLLTVLQRMFP